ncbi:MAG: hypothetical protein NW226_04140 [Microscillaceae bacterium]|nr:hypothetical protein [Microscillaceae bacterium]
METLHEDELWKISYNPSKNYIKTEWTGKALSDQDFDVKTQLIIQFMEQYQPKAFLADAAKFNYVIIPEKQDWHNGILFPIFKKVGLGKMAIITPEDFFSQISIKQAYDEEYDFATQYFASEEEAMKWLEV